MKMGLRIHLCDPGYQQLSIRRTRVLRNLVNTFFSSSWIIKDDKRQFCKGAREAKHAGKQEGDPFPPSGVNAMVFVALHSAKSGLGVALGFRAQISRRGCRPLLIILPATILARSCLEIRQLYLVLTYTSVTDRSEKKIF